MTSDTPIALPDVNVLVAAHLVAHAHHQVAASWIATTPQLALTPITEAGFVRVMLNPVVTGRQFRTVDIVGALRDLRALPLCDFLSDDASFTATELPLAGMQGHRQVTDYHLLNLAISRGGRLITLDRRFPESLPPQWRGRVTVLGAEP